LAKPLRNPFQNYDYAQNRNLGGTKISTNYVIKCCKKRQFKRNSADYEQYAAKRNHYFREIKNAKNSHWNKFLENAKEKDIFKIYKYTKFQRVEKLPIIVEEGQKVVNFEEKCNIFLKIMFPDPPITDAINWNNYRASNKWKWKTITNAEIKQAIFSSSIKKAPGQDNISFAIIRKAYNIIPNIFNALFRSLLVHGFHPSCFEEVISAILRKSDRNPTLPKSYRIIALINCMAKISEKIIATRLAHMTEMTDLLHPMQISGRKQKSAIDAAMILMHKIQRGKTDEIKSVLFMDVKDAFDHVSLNQLLHICQELELPLILCK
jgi:hypothetical protein